VFDGVLSSLACDRLCFSIMQARCQGSEGFAVLAGGLFGWGFDLSWSGLWSWCGSEVVVVLPV